MRYLDPKNDLIFKKVFGEHPHLLRSFLNALLPLEEGRQIESLEYLQPEMVPEIPLLGKTSIVDVLCRDNRGRQFIVEMQMLWTDAFKSRVLFNASKAYVNQLDRGKGYVSLQPVYALSLLNHDFEPTTPEFYHHYRIVHTTQPERVLEGLEFVFVELPKFQAKNLRDKRMLVLWLRFLTEIQDRTTTVAPELLADPDVLEALGLVQASSLTKAEMISYDKYWDIISTERTLYAGALWEGRTEGRVEGRIEGRAEGRTEGLAEGRTEGRAEGAREQARQSARLLREQGVADTVIQLATGLSAAELADL